MLDDAEQRVMGAWNTIGRFCVDLLVTSGLWVRRVMLLAVGYLHRTII